MNREEQISSLRTDLLTMVKEHLTPVAIHYNYSEAPLEANIKWRPLVLFLGNYSSGKSTLINDFLGANIQASGQAPTDDSFTVITYDESDSDDTLIRVTEERDGKFLLNDSEYPFESLKRHGQRFTAHFCLKKVNSPFLKTLAIIDTPGMLDSISERNRGYNYQEVIGDLAQIADLVLVLFDPHKAGTVREAHTSLRDTLPDRTFEDRVLFVLNRIDECASLIDLLQVYGTLCWNLSQITGRKDIPTIHLMHSPQAAVNSGNGMDRDTSFLHYLENQRKDLKTALLKAPQRRLDNLASFVETHSERLSHLLEALISYRRQLGRARIRFALGSLVLSTLVGGAAAMTMLTTNILPSADLKLVLSNGGGVALLIFIISLIVFRKISEPRFFRRHLKDLDNLTLLENQTRRDSWQSVQALADAYLKKTGGRFSLGKVRREYNAVYDVFDKRSREILEALKELENIPREDSPN